MKWTTDDLSVGQEVEATRFLGGGSVEEEFETVTVVDFDTYDMKDGTTPLRRAIVAFADGQEVPFIEGSPSLRVPT